jgi:hypothetical protein
MRHKVDLYRLGRGLQHRKTPCACEEKGKDPASGKRLHKRPLGFTKLSVSCVNSE